MYFSCTFSYMSYIILMFFLYYSSPPSPTLAGALRLRDNLAQKGHRRPQMKAPEHSRDAMMDFYHAAGRCWEISDSRNLPLGICPARLMSLIMTKDKKKTTITHVIAYSERPVGIQDRKATMAIKTTIRMTNG